MAANYKAVATTVGRAKGAIFCLAGLSFCCAAFLYVIAGMNGWKLWSNTGGMQNVEGCKRIAKRDGGELTGAFEPVLWRAGSEQEEPVWRPMNQITGNDLKLFSLRYLTSYKNPCWYELIDDASVANFWSSSIRFKGEDAANSISVDDLLGDYKSRLKRDSTPVRLRCLPYFMVIGQPKSGTTDLYFRIGQHPQVAVAATKGPHWWTRKQFGFGSVPPATFSSYVDVFAFASELIRKSGTSDSSGKLRYHVVTGEASPSTLWDTSGPFSVYNHKKDAVNGCGMEDSESKFLSPMNEFEDDIWWQWIPKQIKILLPKVKLIVIFRNPTDRLYSDFLYFNKSYNKSRETFHLLVKQALEIFDSCRTISSASACAYSEKIRNRTKIRLHIGLYAIYLRDWLTHFPRDQIFVIRTEDYSENPNEVMKKVFDFLQLRELKKKEAARVWLFPPMNRNRNLTRYGAMLAETRMLLDDFYFPFNRELSNIFRDVRFMWKTQNNSR